MTPTITQVIADRADSLTIERLAIKKGITLTATPKLNGLHAAFAGFTARVEAAAGKLTARMDSVGAYTETAVQKFSGAVDTIEAQAKTIDDAANQITNGAPPGPLPDSATPPPAPPAS